MTTRLAQVTAWLRRHERWLLPLFFGVLAFSLRLWQNTVVPPSPYWEEAALGYDAYSILKTGHDHHGNLLPLVAFPSFGDFKPSLYFYTLVPSIALFGLNTWAVRFPAVIFSSATVVLLYPLARRLTSVKVAAWAAFLLAIQPWAWQVGRVGFEVNLAVFLLMAGVYTLLRATSAWSQTKQTRSFWLWSVLAAGSFALSMYSYHAARLLAPFFGVTTLLFTLPWEKPRLLRSARRWLRWLPAIALGLCLLFPLLLSLTSPTVQQRFQETSVFADLEPVLRSNQLREQTGNTWLFRVLYHRYIFWGERLLTSYLSHFSPTFLFGQGDANPRHTSQWLGALYPWEALTLLVGVASGARLWRRRREYWLVLSLTLLSPVAAMVTTATPHALRALPLAVWLAWWSGLGLVELLTWLRQRSRQMLGKHPAQLWLARTLPWLVAIFCLISWGFLWVYYRYQYSVETAKEWQYSYAEVVQLVRENQQPNETVYVSRFYGRPAMYFFFYNQTDPREVQAASLTAPQDQQEFLEFGSWHFVDTVPQEPGLYAMPASTPLPPDATLLQTVNDKEGQPIWIVYRHS